MQLLYECSGAHCSGFVLWSCASLLWGVGRKTGVEMPDASMALFGFWVLLDVLSLMPPASSVHHRCVVKYLISHFRSSLRIVCPSAWSTVHPGQNTGSGILHHSSDTAVCHCLSGSPVGFGRSSLPSALSPAEPVTHHSHAAPLLGLLPPYVRRC